jgi:hypothetical protein
VSSYVLFIAYRLNVLAARQIVLLTTGDSTELQLRGENGTTTRRVVLSGARSPEA